jgi:hypothetical protein
MARRKSLRARVLQVDPLRFASGMRWLAEEPASGAARAPREPSASIHVDIIRPADLVALSVDAVGCELLSDGNQRAHLRPIAGQRAPCLIVKYAFQHVGEEAVYEGQTGVERFVDEKDPDKPPKPPVPAPKPALNARPTPPVGARAARGTRLVFRIPAEERIEFSTAGILAAMSRLALKVHELATPGDAPTRAATTMRRARVPKKKTQPSRVVLGDLVGTIAEDIITVSRASKQELRELGAPKDGTLAAVAFQALELRRARTLLQSRTGVAESASLLRGREILGDLFSGHVGITRDGGTHSRPPKPDETSIEAPFRLVISPSEEARWAHVTEPAGAQGASQHVELWHSRLGNLGNRPDGSTFTDEKNARRRIVRAIWARDRDRMAPADWRDPTRNKPDHGDSDPFRMSLDGADRQMLVQQTSETVRADRVRVAPIPVAARALWLSGLGAWLDLHGVWKTRPYSDAGIRSMLAWDHLAPMGRDQFVRAVYPGYLYPHGHQAALVKVTERKMKDASPSLAALYQRKFLVITEPRRTYSNSLEFHFSEVSIGPLVTPPLQDPSGVPGDSQDNYFWPKINGQPFMFIVDGVDHMGRNVRHPQALMWVAEHYGDYTAVNNAYDQAQERIVDALGQSIAFAPQITGGDTSLTTTKLRYRGRAQRGVSTPYLSSADVRVPAAEVLSPTGPVTIAYGDLYHSKGFDSTANSGQVWAKVLVTGDLPGVLQHTTDPQVSLPQLRFGAGAPSTSERSGGFLTPDIPIRALSRTMGTVGDPAGAATQHFDPKVFFKGSLPKLFGLIDLTDVTMVVDSDLLAMPQVIAEFMGRIEGLIKEMGRAVTAIADAVSEADAMLASAAARDPAVRAQWKKQAQDAIDAANAAQSGFDGLEDKFKDLVSLVKNQGDSTAAVKALRDQFKKSIDLAVTDLEKLADNMPPVMGKLLRAIAGALKTFVADALTLASDIGQYAQGMAESGSIARVRLEWKPKLKSWPDGEPLIELKKDSLLLSIQARAGFDGKGSTHVLADLRDFTLHLFPKAELISLKFSRFSFMVEGNKKPEIDIVFEDIGFHGVLSFVEDIKKLIPLDGFSDPPNMQVTKDGMLAGFSVDLPEIAVGMFSITNLSLGADVQVPFIGKAVTVGFNFCTREDPFTIAVAFLGGGGWCGIRCSADGLEVLEVGLEAGACIAVNFGVASGSVSAMLGVYIRIETDAGSISGYFRLRGEVDVLGIVSACIELYMELKYQFDTGKLIGQARITVNVKVMGIGKSVEISAQRTFVGSNGDPSFLEVMGAETGESAAWNTYCIAFAEEA